jgi:hypothetical protein
MLIQKEYKDLIDKENMRQIFVNAISVVEINKHSKAKQFKDIEMFSDQLKMYDYILNEYEEVVIEVNHQAERSNLFG